MNQKNFWIWIILLIVLTAIIWVANYFIVERRIFQQQPVSTTGSNPITNSAPTPIPAKPKLIQPQSPTHIPQAHNTLGFNSIKLLATEEKNHNIFISPSSIALALSMVYNGAGSETKSAMQKTLQFQNLDIDTINQESLGLINSLKNPDPKVTLSIANSVWAKDGVNFNQEFRDLVAGYFKAEISNLDFTNPDAATTINSWVSKNTQDKIKSIVPSPIPRGMKMILINAVYFKGSWTQAFDQKKTEDRDFVRIADTPLKVPFMRQHEDMRYLETRDFQSVSLPYGENKRLSMYVFLPKDLDTFVQSLDTYKWNDWMSQYKEEDVTLLLPRFKMEYEKGLVPLLTQLGMEVAFQDNADFTGISNDLKLSSVIHKTFVEVNEEGTEAAAVTAIAVVATEAFNPSKKIFYMEVNRPFFVAIRDNQTQEILFMGTIQQP